VKAEGKKVGVQEWGKKSRSGKGEFQKQLKSKDSGAGGGKSTIQERTIERKLFTGQKVGAGKRGVWGRRCIGAGEKAWEWKGWRGLAQGAKSFFERRVPQRLGKKFLKPLERSLLKRGRRPGGKGAVNKW